MGTNYYTTAEPPCEKCGRGSEQLHIGKSSAGWKFLFAPYPEHGLTSWRAWQTFLTNRVIQDEYGAIVDLADLKALVEAKQGDGMLDGATAPESMYGRPLGKRSDIETADEYGYRFSTTADFS